MNFRLIVVIVVVLCCVGCFQFGCELARGQETPDKAIASPKKTAISASVEKEAVKAESVKQQPQGLPKIVFEKTVYDFSDTDPGSKQKCTFTFVNAGSAVLKIDKVKAPCGCTVPTLAKKEYAPGERGQIDVTFKVPQKRGRISKQIYVHSNDPDNRRFTLTVKANVILQVEANPKKLKLLLDDPNLSDPNSDAYIIKLTSSDNQPFSIKSFKSKNNVFTADIDSSQKATEFVIRPKINVEKLKKTLMGQITIKLTHPKCRYVTVEYEAIAEFETSPKTILVTNAVELEPQMRTLWVMSNYGDNMEIKSTYSDKGSVKTVRQNKKGNRFELELQIMPPKRLGKLAFFSDKFHIELKSGHKLSLNCRIFYARRKK